MRAALTALLVGAVLAAGCTSDTDSSPAASPSADAPAADAPSTDTTDGTSDDTSEASQDDAPAGARVTDEPGDVEVAISMFSFEEDTVEISAGETVSWTNQDATLHTVTSGVDGEPDGAFHVEFDGRDTTASVTFDEPGEYHYFCSPHNFMIGTVVVTE